MDRLIVRPSDEFRQRLADSMETAAEESGGLVLVGNLIRDQLLKVRDWNVGSAMSMVLIALSAGIYLLYRKVGGDDLGVI